MVKILGFMLMKITKITQLATKIPSFCSGGFQMVESLKLPFPLMEPLFAACVSLCGAREGHIHPSPEKKLIDLKSTENLMDCSFPISSIY